MIKVTSQKNQYKIPSHGTILQSLEQAALPNKSQCRSGYCGFCKCKIKQGSVTYVTEPLGFIRDSEILTCISIANGNIEIEF